MQTFTYVAVIVPFNSRGSIGHVFSSYLTARNLRRARWLLVAVFFASFLVISYVPYLPFLVVVIIAAFEYMANQLADLDTPGYDWAVDRFAEDFEAPDEDPIRSLKAQYVEGEISEEEFEAQLARLLQDEDEDSNSEVVEIAHSEERSRR